jgi:hypothetical protein
MMPIADGGLCHLGQHGERVAQQQVLQRTSAI